jgi:hypothetical protein
LDEQWLRELEIKVHDTHHSNAQVYRAELGSAMSLWRQG